MTFKAFVTSRMNPFLGLRPPRGCMYQDMFPALRDCLIELAGVNKTAERSSELEWMESFAGGRVNAVCVEAADGAEEVPTITALRAIWHRTEPPRLKKPTCGKCVDGFLVKYSLHTKERLGETVRTVKEEITEDQYMGLQGLARDDQGNILHPVRPKLDPQVQAVYSGAGRCPCAGGPSAS